MALKDAINRELNSRGVSASERKALETLTVARVAQERTGSSVNLNTQNRSTGMSVNTADRVLRAASARRAQAAQEKQKKSAETARKQSGVPFTDVAQATFGGDGVSRWQKDTGEHNLMDTRAKVVGAINYNIDRSRNMKSDAAMLRNQVLSDTDYDSEEYKRAEALEREAKRVDEKTDLLKKQVGYRDANGAGVGGHATLAGLADIPTSIINTLSIPERYIMPVLTGGTKEDWINSGMGLTGVAQEGKKFVESEMEKAHEAAGDSKNAHRGADMTRMIANGAGQAAVAWATAGIGLGSNAARLGGQAAKGLAGTLKTTISNMASKPTFWTSFLQTAGASYDQAMEDGANDLAAVSYGLLNGMMNAAVEVGGGIEELPNAIKGGGEPLLAWVKSTIDEGKEEVIQGVIERGLQGIYGKNNPAVSLTDKDAVFSLPAAAEEFGGGALVGGVLGGVGALTNAAIGGFRDYRANSQQETSTPLPYTEAEANAIRKDAKTFKNVVVGLDTTVSSFFDKWKNGRKSHLGEKLEKLYLGKLSNDSLERVSDILGYDVDARDVIVTNDDIKHISDGHDLPTAIIEALPDIVANPDGIEAGHKGTGKNAEKTGVLFRKTLPDGNVLAVHFDNPGRGTLQLTTLYTTKKASATTSETNTANAADVRTPVASEPVTPATVNVAQNRQPVKQYTEQQKQNVKTAVRVIEEATARGANVNNGTIDGIALMNGENANSLHAALEEAVELGAVRKSKRGNYVVDEAYHEDTFFAAPKSVGLDVYGDNANPSIGAADAGFTQRDGVASQDKVHTQSNWMTQQDYDSMEDYAKNPRHDRVSFEERQGRALDEMWRTDSNTLVDELMSDYGEDWHADDFVRAQELSKQYAANGDYATVSDLAAATNNYKTKTGQDLQVTQNYIDAGLNAVAQQQKTILGSKEAQRNVDNTTNQIKDAVEGAAQKAAENTVNHLRDEANRKQNTDENTGIDPNELGRALADRMIRDTEDVPRKTNAARTIFNDLLKFAKDNGAPQRKKGAKRTAANVLRDYFENRAIYDKAWQSAQFYINNEARSNNPELTEMFDQILGTSNVTYMPTGSMTSEQVIRAVIFTADSLGVKKAQLQELSALNATDAITETIANQLIESSGATESDSGAIRKAVQDYVASVAKEVDQDAYVGKILNRLMRNGLDVKIKDILEKNWHSKKIVHGALVKRLTADYGLTGGDAQNAASLIEQRFFNELEIESRAKLDSIFSAKGKKNSEADSTDRNLELFKRFYNLGAFDDGAYRSLALQKTLGDYGITQDDVQYTYETAERIDKAGDNADELVSVIEDISRRRNMQYDHVAKLIQKNKGDIGWLKSLASKGLQGYSLDFVKPSVGERVSGFVIKNQLFRITTAAANFVSNTASVVAEQAATVSGLNFAADKLMSLGTGITTQHAEKGFLSKEARQKGHELAQKSYVEVWLDVNASDASEKYTGRGTRQHKMNGGKWNQFQSITDAVLSVALNTSDQYFNGIQQGATEEALRSKVENGTLTAEQANEIASIRGIDTTFHDKTALGTGLSAVQRGLNVIGFKDRSFGLGNAIVGNYTNVPASLVMRMYGYSPAGYIKALSDVAGVVIDGKRGINESTNMRTGETTTLAQRQARAAQEVGRATIGTASLIALTALAMKGVLKRFGDDDDYDENAWDAAEGNVGITLNWSALARGVSSGEWSWKNGDVTTQLGRLEPFTSSMNMAVAISDMAKEAGGIGKLKPGDYARANLNSMLDSISDLSMIQNINDIMGAIKYIGSGDDAVSAAQMLGQELLENNVTSLVPGLVQQTAKASDEYYRDTSSDTFSGKVANSLKNAIPGLRQTLPVKQTSGGDKMYEDNDFLRWTNAMVNPFTTQTYAKNALTDYLEEVSQHTDSAVYPTRKAPNTLDIGDKKVTLSLDEKRQYMDAYTESWSKLTQDFKNSAAYSKMTEEERAETAHRIRNEAAAQAKTEIQRAHGVNESKTNADKAKEAGVDVGTYLAIQGTIDELDPVDGKKQVSDWQKYEAIADAHYLSDAERYKLLSAYASSDSTKEAFAEMQKDGASMKDVQDYISLRAAFNDAQAKDADEQDYNVFDALLGNYGKVDDGVKELLDAVDGFARVAAAKENGISMEKYYELKDVHDAFGKEVDENGDNIKASVKAAKWSNYLADRKDLSDEQRSWLKSEVAYWTMSKADPKKYEALVSSGIDDDAALSLFEGMSELEPAAGASQVAVWQQYSVILDSNLSEEDLQRALKTYSSTGNKKDGTKTYPAYTHVMAARRAGYSYKTAVKFMEIMAKNGNNKNATIAAANKAGLQGAALWSIFKSK